ncbi:hypothetical protein [Nocardia sp. GAS34]|uniref:hypothetical protein n=1 Tax=unclassified Nocardia TaxID=2637762 RepID=UPI003D23863B
MLRRAVASIIVDRLNSNYLRLACELPSLLDELHRARLQQPEAGVNSLLVQAYRAADAIADKYGYPDLSARIIAMMNDVADDDLLAATTAYVRTELFFGNHQFATGRKLLERAADSVNPADSIRAAATFGALHMRAAVVAGREFLTETARAHLVEAERAAQNVPEAAYLGTAFGQSSVRIHRVSLSVELGDIDTALAVARAWAPGAEVPAERRSHFYIDVARANLQASRHDEALTAINTARSIAPQHTNSHPQVRDMLTRLSL